MEEVRYNSLHTYFMISYTGNSRKGKNMMTDSRSVVLLGAQHGQIGLIATGHKEIWGVN